jgi:hypothetical protein
LNPWSDYLDLFKPAPRSDSGKKTASAAVSSILSDGQGPPVAGAVQQQVRIRIPGVAAAGKVSKAGSSAVPGSGPAAISTARSRGAAGGGAVGQGRQRGRTADLSGLVAAVKIRT